MARASQWAAVILVKNTESGRSELYIAEVLPFGASAAVYAFNRFARAIWRIGAVLFSLIWDNFFDDYPQLDLAKSGGHASTTAERLLDLIGWRFSKEEKKRLPFAKTFQALGVEFVLVHTEEGKVVVRNKPSRADDLEELYKEVSSTRYLPSSLATTIMGRVHFAEGQVFARQASLFMPLLRARAAGKLEGADASDQMLIELVWLVTFLRVATPRVLVANDPRPPLLIFTDAALEGEQDEVASLGAVMVDAEDVEFFMHKLEDEQLRRLQTYTSKVITPLEVIPAVASFDVWKARTLHRRIFVFIDNDGARACLIKMHSDVPAIHAALRCLGEQLAKHPCFPWFSRVPSASNCSDAVSRLKPWEVLKPGASEATFCWATFFKGKDWSNPITLSKQLAKLKLASARRKRECK